MNTIAERIKHLRNSRQLTQQDMADKLCIAISTYQKIEQGCNKDIKITMLTDIATVLATSVGNLLDEKPKKELFIVPIPQDKSYYQSPSNSLLDNTEACKKLREQCKEHQQEFEDLRKLFIRVQAEVAKTDAYMKTLPLSAR